MEKMDLISDILQTIKILKEIENPSKDVERALSILDKAVDKETNKMLMGLMSLGEGIGYADLRDRVMRLAGFLDTMEQNQKKKE